MSGWIAIAAFMQRLHIRWAFYHAQQRDRHAAKAEAHLDKAKWWFWRRIERLAARSKRQSVSKGNGKEQGR